MANRNYNELAKNNKKTINKIQHRGREYVVTIDIYVVLLLPIAYSCDKGVCVVPSRSMRSQFSARVSLRSTIPREVPYTAMDVGYCGETKLREITRKIHMQKSPLPVFRYVKFQEEPTIEIA